MRITELTADKKHLVKVCFDDGTVRLMDKDVCIDAALKKGMEIDAGQLGDICRDSDYRRARSRALWYLDRSDHTEKALLNKLLRAGFEKSACEAVLARLCELGLVDDVRFAERFCERAAECNMSKREAFYKMLQKGVPYDVAKQALDSVNTGEEEQIKALLEGKYSAKLAREDGLQKVYAALVRKGFSYSAVKSALKKYSEELEFGEEY